MASIRGRLENLAFEGDVWQETLDELRGLLGTDTALAYLPARGPAHWTFEFGHVSLATPALARVYDLFVEFVTSQDAKRKSWAAYDPVRPEPAQRNRALHTSDLRWPGKLAHLYDKMGAPELEPDQVRVLISDGPRLLGWVGGVSYRPVALEGRKVLQDLVPALRTRLAFDELIRDRDLAKASLETAMAAIELPCLLLDGAGKLQHANAAARLLGERQRDFLASAQRALGTPDDRYDVRPVLVRGMPKSTLVTTRTATEQGASRLSRVAARWQLTPRQAAVLELVIAGLGNKQIALRLGIVEGTVELHVTAIFRKARVDSRPTLAARFWTEI